MKDSKTIRFSKKTEAHASAPKDLLSPAELIRHAEAIIRFEGEIALNAQGGLPGQAKASEPEAEPMSPKPASLEDLRRPKGAVLVKREVKAPELQNVIPLSKRKKD